MTGKRILLAEDEINMRHMLMGYLTRHGVSTTAVDNGHDLILLVTASKDFDLVVCDINLPRGDGEEIFRVLGSLPKIPPLIFITGYPQGCPPEGMVILQKPFREEEFLAVVQEAMKIDPEPLRLVN